MEKPARCAQPQRVRGGFYGLDELWCAFASAEDRGCAAGTGVKSRLPMWDKFMNDLTLPDAAGSFLYLILIESRHRR